MSKSEEKFLVTAPHSLHLVDGQAYQANSVLATNMNEGEIQQVVGEAGGVDPERVEVIYPDRRPKTKVGRMAVAFSSSRWNSSWDPKAPKTDPNLN